MYSGAGSGTSIGSSSSFHFRRRGDAGPPERAEIRVAATGTGSAGRGLRKRGRQGARRERVVRFGSGLRLPAEPMARRAREPIRRLSRRAAVTADRVRGEADSRLPAIRKRRLTRFARPPILSRGRRAGRPTRASGSRAMMRTERAFHD